MRYTSFAVLQILLWIGNQAVTALSLVQSPSIEALSGSVSRKLYKLPGKDGHLQPVRKGFAKLGWVPTAGDDWEVLWSFEVPFESKKPGMKDVREEVFCALVACCLFDYLVLFASARGFDPAFALRPVPQYKHPICRSPS